MEDWSEQINSQIDDKLKEARKSDVRFFRVDEFKRNVERAGTFSKRCPDCNKEKINIGEVVRKIDDAINSPGAARRDYDRLINRLATHMQKKHGYFPPFHYTYTYSFYGIVAGLLIGYLLMMLFSDYNWAILSAGFSAGLIIGYLRGGQKDRRIREKKMLM
jgi:hypothetical protein